MPITQADLDNWFTYHSPKPGQPERYVAIREAAKNFAEVIVANTPAVADQTYAIRLVRQAVMTANQSIACE
jgi:hypothetical protein